MSKISEFSCAHASDQRISKKMDLTHSLTHNAMSKIAHIRAQMAGWQPYISFMRASLDPCIHEQAALSSCRCMRYSVIEPASQPRAGGRQIWPGQ